MRFPQLWLIVVALVMLSGCGGSERYAEAGTDNTTVSSASVPVPVQPKVVAKKKPASTATFLAKPAMRETVLTGFTRARKTMTLVTEVAGRVDAVMADVGQSLGSDGVFAKLDTTFVRLDLEANRAEQDRLLSDVKFSKTEMNRYKKLVKGKTAAQSVLDSHINKHTSASQQLRKLRIEERKLLEKLTRHTLKAPAGWKVITRHIEPGEWLAAGTAVAELGRYDVLLVPYALSSAQFQAIKRMKQITLDMPDLKRKVDAHIALVSPGFDPETRKINVDLEVSNGDLVFRGGLRTTLKLNVDDASGAVLVPASAITKAYEEFFLVRKDGSRVRVTLLGSGPGNTRRVTSPEVRPGDRFLVDPTP